MFTLEDLLEQFEKISETLDCGDNSCPFKKKNKYGVYGMRTNGGCRCLKDLPHQQWRSIYRLLQMMKVINDEKES